jgi:hypothetical protein
MSTLETLSRPMPIGAAAIPLAYLMMADIPVMLWGQPGAGKSDVVGQVSRAIGREAVSMHLAQMDAVDLRGVPSVINGRTHWNPPAEFPADDGAPRTLFLDEINAAQAAVQVAGYQLVLERRLGAFHLPAGTRIVAAGNRAADKAAAQRMPSALANRMAHLDVAPDLDSWQRWAAGDAREPFVAPAPLPVRADGSIHPMVRAFLRLRPALFAPTDFASKPEIRAFPSPRTWAMVSRIADALPPHRLTLVSAIVGPEAALQFEAFAALYSRVPDIIGAVLSAPDAAPIPTDPGVLYGVVTALGSIADRRNVGAITRYAFRLPADYGVLCGVDLFTRNPDLRETAAHVEWIARFHGEQF